METVQCSACEGRKMRLGWDDCGREIETECDLCAGKGTLGIRRDPILFRKIINVSEPALSARRGALAMILSMAILTGCQTPTPCPCASPSPSSTLSPEPSSSPSISPSPSVSPTTPSPSPDPEPTASPSPGPSLFGMINETVSLELRPASSSEEIPLIEGIRIEAFEIQSVTTTRPSFSGARIGEHEDPLFPVARLRAGVSYWIDLTPLQAGTFEIPLSGKIIRVRGLAHTMPRRPSHPIYSELQVQRIREAHQLPDQGETLQARCALNSKYRELMRSHRVEPIKSWTFDYPSVRNGRIDLDSYFPNLGCSFRQQVLTGAIADPILWGPNPATAPSTALLEATRASIQAGEIPAGSRAYVWDEGELDPALSATALARAQQAAPYIGTYITRRPSETFRPFVRTFCPVQDWATPGMASCYYTSCMAHGCGALSLSGTPLTVVEADRVHPRAFPIVSKVLGGQESLYFAVSVALPTAWRADGIFNPDDGKGNGDGTLLYPGLPGVKGLSDHIPVPSIRLKQWRRGSYDLEYQKLAEEAGLPLKLPVRGARDWSKDEREYDAFRESVARALLGL
jgi:hypothetical protein